MSYILDALRRADAERERDPARGIHAQPAAMLPDAGRSRVPGWAWPTAAVLVLAVGAAVSWQRASSPAPVASAPATPTMPVAAAPLAPAAPVAPAVMPPAPVVIERVVRVVPAAPAQATIKAPPAAAAASAPAAAERIYNVLELPADVQSALPKLAITGGVHSEIPAQRMLIVGGQVMHEGAELAPGVVLEQIRPRGAVLKFRGYRYGVKY